VNTTYRVNRVLLGLAVAGVVACGVTLIVRMNEDDLVPGGVRTGVYLGYLVLAAIVMSVVVRSSTTVADEGIVVRRIGPARRYPWSAITDIRIEPVNTMSRRTVQGVVLYDTELRRIVLPYVNTRRLDGIEATRSVMKGLRRRVAKAAGPTDGPERQARIAKLGRRITTRQGRERVWFSATLAAFITFLATAVLVSQLPMLVPDEPAATDPLRKIPLLIVVLPILVFAATAAIGLVRKRRR
jgi:Bacterial PH domain